MIFFSLLIFTFFNAECSAGGGGGPVVLFLFYFIYLFNIF